MGFEPTVSFPTHAFQACRFGRSRTPPGHCTARTRRRRPGDLRHTSDTAESCCLPALTRFTGCGCTGPGRHLRVRTDHHDTPRHRGRVHWADLRAGRATARPGLGRVTGDGLPVALPPLSTPPVQRRARPGAGGPGPPQRRARRPRGPRLPVQRTPGNGQDLHRPHPGQGPQLRAPHRRRAVRHLRQLPGHRRRHLLRRAGARRRLQQRRGERARAGGPGQPGFARAHQGVHPRRGPHAHGRRLGRAAQDPGGAARPRGVRAGHHRPPQGAGHHSQPHPALRVPPAHGRRTGRARGLGHPRRRPGARRRRHRPGGARRGRVGAGHALRPGPGGCRGWRGRRRRVGRRPGRRHRRIRRRPSPGGRGRRPRFGPRRPGAGRRGPGPPARRLPAPHGRGNRSPAGR